MRILLTGASSFTGYWFAQALARAGHNVLAPLKQARKTDDALRAERLRRLADHVEFVEDCPFGSPRFMDLIAAQNFDVLCHHAAQVAEYRSNDFDIAQAVLLNTFNLRPILAAMAKRGLQSVILTGSFFEHDEGAGTQPLVAFTPYGISKGLTAVIIRHRCHEIGMRFGKFVVPHPFGPLEQPRLGAYLAKTWSAGAAAEIRTPAYVRDNIPVGLLAECYLRFVQQSVCAPLVTRINPSGYVETQGAFVERLAREIRRRTGLECRLALLQQTEFSEPLVRINTDSAWRYVESWDENGFWDEYAQCYR